MRDVRCQGCLCKSRCSQICAKKLAIGEVLVGGKDIYHAALLIQEVKPVFVEKQDVGVSPLLWE